MAKANKKTANKKTTSSKKKVAKKVSFFETRFGKMAAMTGAGLLIVLWIVLSVG